MDALVHTIHNRIAVHIRLIQYKSTIHVQLVIVQQKALTGTCDIRLHIILCITVLSSQILHINRLRYGGGMVQYHSSKDSELHSHSKD